MDIPEQEIKKDLRLTIIALVVGFAVTVAILLLIIHLRANPEETKSSPPRKVSESAEKMGNNITEMAREIAPISETYKNMKNYSDSRGGSLIDKKKSGQAESKE